MAHHTFMLEVHRKGARKDAKPELHGLGAAGVPGVTAKMVAEHLGKHGHFDRYAAKVVVKHRSHLVKATADKLHRLTKEDIPEVTVDKELQEEELESFRPQPNLAEGAAPPQPDEEDAIEEPKTAPPDPEKSRQISRALGGSGKTLQEERSTK